jgi:hypothetical protein
MNLLFKYCAVVKYSFDYSNRDRVIIAVITCPCLTPLYKVVSFSGYDRIPRRRPISGSCFERIRRDSGKNTAGRLRAAWPIFSVFRRNFLGAPTG